MHFASGVWPKATLNLTEKPRAMSSPDGQYLATLDGAGKATVWAVETGQQLSVVPDSTNRLTAFAFCPDNRRVLTTGHDHPPTFWETATGRRLSSVQGETSSVECLAVSPQGHHLLTGTWDGQVRLSSRSAEPGILALIPVSSNLIPHLGGFSRDGKRILAALDDRSAGTTVATVWDLNTPKPLASVTHNHPVLQAMFSEDGRRLLTVTRLFTSALAKWEVKVWDLNLALAGEKGCAVGRLLSGPATGADGDSEP